MKIMNASTADSPAMVVYWRRRNASAPSLMALEMVLIPSVPVSCFSTKLVRSPATASDRTLRTITNGSHPDPSLTGEYCHNTAETKPPAWLAPAKPKAWLGRACMDAAKSISCFLQERLDRYE